MAYRLLEPERINGKKITVVGGGDSAIESALLLKDQNEVILSYRKDAFIRIKPKNKEKIDLAISDKSLKVLFSSQLLSISEQSISINVSGERRNIDNDLVYILAGGELPTEFLKNAGIGITRRFGYVVKKQYLVTILH